MLMFFNSFCFVHNFWWIRMAHFIVERHINQNTFLNYMQLM